GGGVALNGCANARILRESGFSRVFVPSAPRDAGCALGAALCVDRLHLHRPHCEMPDHPFWGPEPGDVPRIAGADGLPVDDFRARLAAVTHLGGTARVQTVEREMAPRFHALLEEVGRRTGIPVLLNTSFNLAGEPIVSRAVEAYSTFRRSGIDLLVCGRDLV